MLDAVTKEFGPMREPEVEGKKKRKMDETDTIKNADNAIKKLRTMVSNQKQIPVADIGAEHQLLEADMINQKNKGMKIHVKAGNNVYMLNTGTSCCKLSAGFIVAGFGKGQYKSCTNPSEAAAEKELLYHLKADTLVLLNNSSLRTVKEVLMQKRKKEPTAGVAYHTVAEAGNSSDPSAMEITVNNHVAFVPAGKVKVTEGEGEEDDQQSGVQSQQTTAAKFVPLSSWNKEICASVGVHRVSRLRARWWPW